MTTPNSPRPRRKAVPSPSALLVFLGIHVILGLPLAGIPAFLLYTWARNDRLLDAAGTPAVAKVLQAEEGVGVRRSFWVTYELVVKSSESAVSQKYKRSQPVARSTYEGAKNSGTVPIVYLPKNPRVSRVPDDEIDYRPFLTGLLFAMGVAVIVWTAWELLKYPVARELDTKGQVVAAKVTDVWRTVRGGKGGRFENYYVAYAFGEGHAAYQEIGKDQAQSLHVGDELLIRYLERDPRRSRIEPPKG